MLNVVDRITGDGTFRALVARIRELSPPSTAAARGGDGQDAESAQGVVSADGLWGSFAPALAGAVARALARPLLYVTAHLEQADEARDDIELFCGRTPELLSAFETVPGEGAASDEIHAERLALCSRLLDIKASAGGGEGGADDPHGLLIVVAPIQALLQAVPTPAALEADMLTVGVGQQRTPQSLVDWLVDHGYARLDQVESPGDFALRGDILDIYPPGETDPYRLDFFDDKVESIRSFDVSTQRSSSSFQHVRVAGTVGLAGSGRRARKARQETADSAVTSFLSYLPSNTIVAFSEPIEIQELGRTFWNRLGSPRDMMPVERVFRRASPFAQVHLHALGGVESPDRFRFGVQSLARFETKAGEALAELARLTRERDVLLYCDNEPERERFAELWGSTLGDMPPRLKTRNGLMHQGFDWPGGRLAVVGHHEVFHRYQQRRRIRKTHAARPIESWLDLQAGDYVVHVVHGIARFLGLRVMRKGDSNKSEEFLTLEFADAARMHVPVSQIDLVQKYIGSGAVAPPLSKLGGTRWAKTKERVEEAVCDLAAELLRIQAVRSSQPGISFPEDTPWQREFEGSFIYTETEDQLTAMADIKKDMHKSMPMDRLLCGDVGYGKTELAIRAAFKAVEYGRQVAVLVPTTVLAEQHERTFRERFADYPFVIESLSRFKDRKQQLDTVARARKGQVDILIGTHRLLSKDVGFKDLGLLVIDEEQRFGVEHKERLKNFRETVDVLTMSATPIPRTLHMSLLGIRDICSLETPPLDRRSIVTQVGHWDEALIRNSIMRELNQHALGG